MDLQYSWYEHTSLVQARLWFSLPLIADVSKLLTLDRMESHLRFAKTTYHGIVSFYIKEFPYYRGTSAWRLAVMKV